MTELPLTDGGNADDSSNRPLQVSYTLGDDEPPSTGVVRATAILTDTSPLDLEPLYDVIDPDHLDGMFRTADAGTVSVEASFVYNDCRVAVTPEEIHLQRVDDEE